jgi:glycopeptide antibiotics resistance protein
LKKFKFSLLYILALLLTLPFHVQIKNLLVKSTSFNFVNYVLLGIMAAFFALAFFKAFTSGKPLEITVIFLAAAIVGYFLFQRKIFLSKVFFSNFLHIAEFFILGVLLSKENKKTSSPLPFIILFSSAFAFELVQFFFHNRVVDSNDIWTNVISGLVGMAAGFF